MDVGRQTHVRAGADGYPGIDPDDTHGQTGEERTRRLLDGHPHRAVGGRDEPREETQPKRNLHA
jgi:hypothetical protein